MENLGPERKTGSEVESKDAASGVTDLGGPHGGMCGRDLFKHMCFGTPPTHPPLDPQPPPSHTDETQKYVTEGISISPACHDFTTQTGRSNRRGRPTRGSAC